MLNIIKSNGKDWVSSTQFFDNCGYSAKTKYAHWSLRFIVKNIFFKENLDYVVGKTLTSEKGGRPRQDYLLNPDFAYKLAMQVETEKGEQLREWLLQMMKKVEDKDLITIEEAGLAANFINYYKYVENQKDIESKYMNLFDNNFAKAQSIRNNALDIHTEKVKKEYLEWCQEKGQVQQKGLNKRSMINCYNKYFLIRMALWDYCRANGIVEPKKFPTVVLKVCEAMKVNIYPTNEVNFFQTFELIEELPLSIEDGMKLLTFT